MTRRTQLAVSVGAAIAGTGLMVASVLWRWRTISEDPGFNGSPSRNFDAVGPGLAGYLPGIIALLWLAEAALLADARTQRVLRAIGTAVAVVLAVLLVVIAQDMQQTLTSQFPLDPGARAYARPGPAVIVAGAAVLAYLASIWSAPPGPPAPETPRTARWWAGLLTSVAGLLALPPACVLPAWYSVFPDSRRSDPATDAILLILPMALIGGCLAVASLVLAGDAQQDMRRNCRGWLVFTVLSCGGLTALGWGAMATDSDAVEYGLQATYPGGGLLLGLLACLLLPLGGAIARRQASPVARVHSGVG